jgi:iodotyrosine deiodinase
MSAFVPLANFQEYAPDEMLRRAREFNGEMQRRRTVRQFSDRAVPREIIAAAIEAAGSAPSGAHRQPWHFVAVSDSEVKRRIRVEAERAEQEFYRTAPAEWLEALEPLGTDEHKPYLEVAPWLIGIFAERYGMGEESGRSTNYYVMESVGIATGILITALHHAGLATLTHTPSPMGFLNEVLQRPPNEKAFLLLVVGYPAADAKVPDIRRKPLGTICSWS